MSNVPFFKQYYATERDMNSRQRAFYQHLISSFKRDRFPDVNGNVSYLYARAYEVLAQWKDGSYEAVYDELLNLAEAYHEREGSFAEYCRRWAGDCMIAQGRYGRYLELTEPSVPLGRATMISNLRLNLQRELDLAADPIDLIRLCGVSQTNTAREEPGRYRDHVRAIFAEEEASLAWLTRLEDAGPSIDSQPMYLFSGSSLLHPSELRLHRYDLLADEGAEVICEIKDAARTAENHLRDELKLPQIGEGWVSETALFYALREIFDGVHMVQHGRPRWLGRQHFDIWIPAWKIAVEHHGKQHFEPVTFFGGEEGFVATQKRDRRKMALAKENNVALIISTEEMSHQEVASAIRDVHRSRRLCNR